MYRSTLYLASLLLAGVLLAPAPAAQSALDCPNNVRATVGCDGYAPVQADRSHPLYGAPITRGGGPSVLYAPSEADDPAYRAAVAAALGGTVDYFDATLGTPSVAQMQAYDAVYTWANFAYFDAVAFGDNLAAYSDAGGVVVLGVFTTYDLGNSLSGAIRGPAYSPVTNPTGSNHFASSTYAGDGAIFYDGVSTTTECLFRDFLVTQGSGAVDGTYVDAEIMGAYRPDFGVMYMNGDGASALGCTGDWARLLANMVLEGAGGGPSCDLKYLASDLTYNAGTRQLCAVVTVRNNGASAKTARLELDYNRNGGNPQGTRVLGSGTLPAGAQATRTVCLRVPANAPAGNYNFDLRLVDVATGADCGSYQESISISAPRLSGGDLGADLFEAAPPVDLTPEAASASAAAPGAGVSPNPFARQATISYEVAASAPVRLAVYDVLGREVAVLVDARQEAGTHGAVFEAAGLAAGTYVYRLVVGNDVQTGRMTLAH